MVRETEKKRNKARRRVGEPQKKKREREIEREIVTGRDVERCDNGHKEMRAREANAIYATVNLIRLHGSFVKRPKGERP